MSEQHGEGQNVSAAERWLARFPVPAQRVVASWFAHVKSKGATTPDDMVAQVVVFLGYKQQWAVTTSTRQLCDNTLQALVCDRQGALALAQSVLDQTAWP